MPKEQKLTVVEVTTTAKYVFPTGLNGWTDEQIIEDWFKRHPLSGSHVTRDYYKLGGSEKLVKAEVLNEQESSEPRDLVNVRDMPYNEQTHGPLYTNEQLLAMARVFEVWQWPSHGRPNLTVELRGENSYAVCMDGAVFDKANFAFVFEPLPSNRDDEFKKDTRFSLQRALYIAKQIAMQLQNQYDEWKKDKENYHKRDLDLKNISTKP
jgi:hypothetical protein